jgi:hypothetical protein
VLTMTGDVALGPIPLFHSFDGVDDTTNFGGHGGPPTASDFDGDGQVEFAAAANQFYVVYDPDCTPDGKTLAARPGGKCDRSGVKLPDGVSQLPPYVLWGKLSHDYSSSETGSSIFDFNGDGRAEAVYRDECYLRVYEGNTGNVIYSAPATSGTGQDLPVIADVDGDFATEIVVVRAGAVQGCPSPDPLFPQSGPVATKAGFSVLRDPQDRWASSRPIWNQHAYSVTHVTDDGRIPKSSDVKRNWQEPGLNNFRQNVQGDLGKLKLADLTVELTDLGEICGGASGNIEVSAKVCNRGTNPVQDGAQVAFYLRDKDGGGETSICDAATQTLLSPGDCTTVRCTGAVQGGKDVVVKVDPEHAIADCHPGNNVGASALVLCPVVK